MGAADYAVFRSCFGLAGGLGQACAPVDMNGDDAVGAVDFMLFKNAFGGAPGPSGLAP